MTNVQPFLMFEGKAEEAMTLYVSLFPGSAIGEVTRFGPEGPGAGGSIMRASFTLGGHSVLCFDSPVKHAFTFTPAFSFFVDCTSEEQLRSCAATLGEGGSELMPLGSYGFSRKFAWLNDRFGVSWQINLA